MWKKSVFTQKKREENQRGHEGAIRGGKRTRRTGGLEGTKKP